MSHTPGPWKTEVGTCAGDPIDVYIPKMIGGDECHNLIARVYDGLLYSDKSSEEIRLANAHLITAAPALLEVLTSAPCTCYNPDGSYPHDEANQQCYKSQVKQALTHAQEIL